MDSSLIFLAGSSVGILTLFGGSGSLLTGTGHVPRGILTLLLTIMVGSHLSIFAYNGAFALLLAWRKILKASRLWRLLPLKLRRDLVSLQRLIWP